MTARMIPCLIFEDEHLLVLNKPAGINTHAPSPFAGEGLYDWLRHREPRWSNLAILHRLDKETSGVIVFGKTTTANRSLTAQFTERVVRKKYLLLTDRPPMRADFAVKSRIARVGERYVSGRSGELAETRFRLAHFKFQISNFKLLEAEPLTGRTHQIRVHAAENGFPILGDTLYGGTAFRRLCLHATELRLRHPVSSEEMTFRAPADFLADPRLALRTALVDPGDTDAFRILHGAGDGWPGWHVDRLGSFLLSQSGRPLDREQEDYLHHLLSGGSSHRVPAPPGREAELPAGAYHKILDRRLRAALPQEVSPRRALGQAAPERFTVRENGLRFELSFGEGYSVGLFLDQRDNRRRLLTGHIAAGFPLVESASRPPASGLRLLNTFAYTCGFSVCAAASGARTTSLDLSRKYLDWGRRNFVLNGLDPAGHEFIHGDVFDWLRRLAKKHRVFDVILLDPPTFSQSKERGVFRAETDYFDLVAAVLPLLAPGGVLFASANAARWSPEKFLADVEGAVHAAKRHIIQRHYAPQPPDFPVSRSEPAYLKTAWIRVA